VSRPTPIIGLALDAAGRQATAGALVALALAAERGNVDFVSLDDTLDPDTPSERVHLDAHLALSHVAAATTTIGLLPTVTVTHTEPFHVSKNIATLDLVSGGRAGWQAAVSTTSDAAARFGRREADTADVLFAEADDVVEVVRRLWDSWEDDAVIRDQPTGRYIDRSKVHYVDFEGPFFDVRGPSITPRPPQGQPIVAVRATDDVSATFAARRADLVIVEGDIDTVRSLRSTIRTLAAAHGREADELTILATVTIDDETDAEGLVTELADWFANGSADGFLLQPDQLPARLDWIVAQALPRLAARGLLVGDLAGTTFRQRLGLSRPANRFAAIGGTA
jgi:alkanesulfonate monooxygenase SsuD/methylene tetrahydromethanopterin reductase-like flavin-dependent oxidoreductase (luciferase family)